MATKLPHEIPSRELQTATSGISFPSGNPADGQIITYSGTTGDLHWDNPPQGGGGGGDVAVQDEGVQVTAAASTLDFVGDGVWVSDAGGGKATITVSGIQGVGSTSAPMPLQHIETIEVTGSATSSVTFSNLDGNTDDTYILEYYIDCVLSSAHFVQLKPNGSTTNTYGTRTTHDTNSTEHNNYWFVGALALSTEQESGFIEIQAKAGTQRSYRAASTLSQGDTAADQFVRAYGGFWADTSTNITSLEIATSTAVNAIGVGSYFKLYKRQPDATMQVPVMLPIGSPMVHIETIEVSATTGSITFNGLDGDADRHYVMYYRIVNNDSPTARTFTIQPNGTNTNQDSTKLAAGTETDEIEMTIAEFGNTDMVGRLEFWPVTGNLRGYTSANGAIISTPDVTSHHYAGVWADTSTNITSLTIDQASNAMGAGSWFSLWKLDVKGEVASGKGLIVQDEGVKITDAASAFNFTGDPVTVTTVSGVVQVAVSGTGGGGGAVAVSDEGTEITAAASNLNFVGPGVQVTDGGGGEATITISGANTASLEFLDIIEVGADTTTVTFGAGGDGLYQTPLNGDTDEEYVLGFHFPATTSGPTAFELRPNGSTANQHGARHFGGSSAGNSANSRLHLEASIASGFITSGGVATFQAKSGAQRGFSATCILTDLASDYSMHNTGLWDDTSTVVTSLDIVSTVASQIKSGARFVLWRRRAVFSSATPAEISIKDSGNEILPAVSSLNFTGRGANLTNAGNNQVDIEMVPAVGAIGGMWQYVETVEVTGAATTELGFTGLDGNTDEEYLIIFNLIHAEGGTARDFRLRINDLDSTTNVAATNYQTGTSSTFSDLVIARTTREYISGSIRFIATEYPDGSATSRPRTAIFEAVVGDDPAVSTSTFDLRGSSIWTDAGVNVTALKIESTVQALDTASTSLAVGSIMSLFKRVPNNKINGVTGNASALEFVDIIEVTGDTQTVTFGAGGDGKYGTALDGNLDEVYELRWQLAPPTATVNYDVRPNGVTSNIFGARHYGGSTAGNSVNTLFQMGSMTSGFDGLGGEGTIIAKTGNSRYWIAKSMQYQGGSRWDINNSAIWTDTTTNITSLDIVCDTASQLKAGSVITLWRRRAIPEGARPIEVLDEGVTVSENVAHMDFVGNLVNVTTTTSGVQVAISGTVGGGGSALDIRDEGVSLDANTASIDFTGTGVTATSSGTNGIRVEIPGSTIGNLQFMDIIEVGANTTSVTFGASGDGVYQAALDGDTDEVYHIEYYLPPPTGGACNYDLLPNGTTSSLEFAGDWKGSSSGNTHGTGAWRIGGSNVNRYTSGIAEVQAKSGKRRAYVSNTIDADGSTQRWRYDWAGIWADTTTNITSLVIQSTVASEIKAGARFVLWRRTSSTVRADSASIYERTVATPVMQGTSSGTLTYSTGRATFGGSAVGLSATLLDDTVTAGTIDVKLMVDNAQALSTTLDTTNVNFNRSAALVGQYAVAPGDEVEVEISHNGLTTTSGNSPNVIVNATFTSDAFVQSPTGPDYLYARLSANQTTNLGVGSHVEFDTEAHRGASISLETGTGQSDGVFVLQPGKLYEVFTTIGVQVNEGTWTMTWYDSDTDTVLAEITGEDNPELYGVDNSASDRSEVPTSTFLIQPTSQLRMDLRVTSTTNMVHYYATQCHVYIKELK